MDGHKRTAFQVADIILRDEGYHIHTDKIQIEKFLLKLRCIISDSVSAVKIYSSSFFTDFSFEIPIDLPPILF